MMEETRSHSGSRRVDEEKGFRRSLSYNEYRLSVLPDGAPILSIEAYCTQGWAEWSHAHAGINQFGASAPAKQVYKKFGLTGEDMATRAEKVIKHYKSLGHPVYSPVSTQLAV